MEFPLRNLNDGEKETIMNAPIYVGILIGCADGEMSADESARIEKVIKTKTFSEKNDVHYLYEDLAENNLHQTIIDLFNASGSTVEEKSQFAHDKLASINTILPKLNPTYAVQYRDSLHDVAVAVAKASGGVLGIGTISVEEKELLDLPMINKI